MQLQEELLFQHIQEGTLKYVMEPDFEIVCEGNMSHL